MNYSIVVIGIAILLRSSLLLLLLLIAIVSRDRFLIENLKIEEQK